MVSIDIRINGMCIAYAKKIIDLIGNIYSHLHDLYMT